MEIWGAQVPTDFVIVAGAILVAALIALAGWGLRRSIRGRAEADLEREVATVRPYTDSMFVMQQRLADELQESLEAEDGSDEEVDLKAREYFRHTLDGTEFTKQIITQFLLKTRRTSRVLYILNFASTVLALIPVIAAIVALVSERPDLALRLDVFGLIVLIVTKGGLWLLTMALIPMLKAVPVGVGTGIGTYYAQRWLKGRERDREPVAKK